MANSGVLTGSFGGSSGSHFTLYCYWTVDSQSQANRTSTVTFRWAVQKDWSYRTYKNPAAWSQTVDGSYDEGSINFDIPASLVSSDYTYATVTKTIQHNADGTKTVSVSGTLDLSGTSAGVGSLSGSFTLPRIAVTPPTINVFAVSDAGTGKSTLGVYVATKSKFSLLASARGNDGATIASYAFYANDVLLQNSTSNMYTQSGVASAGNYVFKLVVTDSYGNSSTRTLSSVTVYPYTRPSISGEIFRCDSSGTAKDDGLYASAKASWSIASVNGLNTATGKVAVNSVNYTLANNTTSVIGGSFAVNQSHPAVFTVTDAFGETATYRTLLYSARYDVVKNPNGGIGFGMYPPDDVFSVNYDAEFMGDMAVSGALIVDGSANLGIPLSVGNGGTGAKTAAAARTALGIMDYSKTAETEVGVWTDGKTLYRKIVQGTMPSGSTQATVSLGLSGVDKYVKVDVFIVRAGDYAQNSNSGSFYQSSDDYFSWYLATPSTGKLIVRGGSSYPIRPYDYVVIVYYTKS